MWPQLFSFGHLSLYSYPLFIGFSWGLAFRMGEERLPIGFLRKTYVLWFIGLFVSSWIGAKILFLLTQNNWDSSELINNSNFWLGGGFVYLGGLIGGSIFSLIFLRLKKLSLSTLDFSIVPLLWAHALGRLGCLLAGCCYGTESNLPWAIHLHSAERHPVQIYEATLLVMLAWVIDKFSKQHLVHYLFGYGCIRFLLEFLRADEIRGMLLGFGTSQLLSLGMVLFALVLSVRLQLAKNID